METKEYLQQIEKCDKQINEKLEEVRRIKELATKITTTLRTDAAGGGGNGDKIGDAVAKIVTLEEEITRDVDRYIDLKREIGAIIDAVEDTDEQTVLVKRYINYEKWEQIALEMGFTYRNVCYIHGDALKTVERLRNKNFS